MAILTLARDDYSQPLNVMGLAENHSYALTVGADGATRIEIPIIGRRTGSVITITPTEDAAIAFGGADVEAALPTVGTGAASGHVIRAGERLELYVSVERPWLAAIQAGASAGVLYISVMDGER